MRRASPQPRTSPTGRWFADFDGRLGALYHAADEAGALVPQWVVVDPTLRILFTAPSPMARP